MGSANPTYYSNPAQTLSRVGVEARTLLQQLRTLSHCYDGVVRIQGDFQNLLPPTAARIATLSVATLSDLLDESSRTANVLGGRESALLSPCEQRLVELCASIESQDYDAMRERAAALVDNDYVAHAIDATASYLAAMRTVADAAVDVDRCGRSTLTPH